MDKSEKKKIKGTPQGFCPLVCDSCGIGCAVESLVLSSFKSKVICISCHQMEKNFETAAPLSWIVRSHQFDNFEDYIEVIFGYFDPIKRESFQKKFDIEEKED